jgi:hypothetical protein
MQFEIKLYFFIIIYVFFKKDFIVFLWKRVDLFNIKKHLAYRSQFQLLNFEGAKKWGSQN